MKVHKIRVKSVSLSDNGVYFVDMQWQDVYTLRWVVRDFKPALHCLTLPKALYNKMYWSVMQAVMAHMAQEPINTREVVVELEY